MADYDVTVPPREGVSPSDHGDERVSDAADSEVGSSSNTSPDGRGRRNTCDPTTIMSTGDGSSDCDSHHDGPSHSMDDEDVASDSASEPEPEHVSAGSHASAGAEEPAAREPSPGEAALTPVPVAEASVAPPREVMLTARPGEVSKRQTERRMRLATQWGVLDPADISTEPAPNTTTTTTTTPEAAAESATPLHSAPVYGRPSQHYRKIDWRAPSPSNETQKKKSRHVNLRTVDKVRPIPDGVNTPRSLALCEELGIDARQLEPKPENTFHSSAVSGDLARMRYESYEKRRQTHMARLLPIYTERYGGEQKQPATDRSADTATPPRSRPSQGRHAHVDASPSRTAAAPTSNHARGQHVVRKANPRVTRDPVESASDIDEVDRRLEAHQAALSRRAREVSASPQPRYDGRPGYLSARTGTTSVGRTTVSPSPAAMRIRSRSVAENRRLTAAEAEVLAEIEYKEHMEQERVARVQQREETVAMARIEQSISREKRTERVIHKRAAVKEAKQYEMYNSIVRRQVAARERRETMEAERKARLEQSIAEKSARSCVNDPYASLVVKRKFSTPVVSRAGSPRVPREQ